MIDEYASKYVRKVSRKGLVIPDEVAQALLKKHEEIGRFTIPVKVLHELIGSNAKTPQRNALTKRLNEQHKIEGKKWYVGVSKDNYIIDIIEE